MELDCNARRLIQSFLRDHLVLPGLELPPIFLHSGFLGRATTGILRSSAVTFGKHIFVSRPVSDIPMDLLVHEAIHVLQYQKHGIPRFVVRYACNYWVALRAGHGWRATCRGVWRLLAPQCSSSRLLAYLTIPDERVARAAQYAFRARTRRKNLV
jgi:hypothetical protein